MVGRHLLHSQGEQPLALKGRGRDRAGTVEKCGQSQGISQRRGRLNLLMGWIVGSLGSRESRLTCKLLPFTEGEAHRERKE